MKLRSAPRLANRAPKYPPRPPDPMTATRMPPSVRAAAAPVKSTGSPPAATETTGAAVHTPQRTLRPPTTFVAVGAPSRKGGEARRSPARDLQVGKQGARTSTTVAGEPLVASLLPSPAPALPFATSRSDSAISTASSRDLHSRNRRRLDA